MRYRAPAVFSLGAWSPPLPAGFLVSCGTQVFSPRLVLRVRDSHPLPSAFPDRSPSDAAFVAEPSNPVLNRARFGLLGVRSPLLAESSLFLALLRCFSWRTYPPSRGDLARARPGFPIRTSPLLTPAHGSAALFAVYHVLPRRLAARHPPYALARLQPVLRRPDASQRVSRVYALVKLPGGFPPPVAVTPR